MYVLQACSFVGLTPARQAVFRIEGAHGNHLVEICAAEVRAFIELIDNNPRSLGSTELKVRSELGKAQTALEWRDPVSAANAGSTG